MPAMGGMSLQDEIARKLQSRNKTSAVTSSNASNQQSSMLFLFRRNFSIN